jgi:hypothetical protein
MFRITFVGDTAVQEKIDPISHFLHLFHEIRDPDGSRTQLLTQFSNGKRHA